MKSNKNIKLLLIVVLISVILSLSVVFAAMSNTLKTDETTIISR